MSDYNVIKSHTPLSCLGCGRSLDGHLSVAEHAKPKVGDASICIYCRSLMVFTEDGFRWPTDEELKEFLDDPNISAGIGAVGELHRRHGVPGA